MAASEHFSSQNLDFADWPVWRKLIDRLGSGVRVRKFGKLTLGSKPRREAANRRIADRKGLLVERPLRPNSAR